MGKIFASKEAFQKAKETPGLFKAVVDQYFHEPVVAEKKRIARVQEMTGSMALPELQNGNVYANTSLAKPDFGFAWKNIFDVPTPDDFVAGYLRIHQLSTGVTFGVVAPGAKAQTYTYTGAQTMIYCPQYMAGVDILDSMVEDNDVYGIEKLLELHRNQYYVRQETVMNDLLWAAGSGAVAISGATTGQALDACATAIGTACAAEGIPVNANTTFLVLTPWALFTRLANALPAYQPQATVTYRPKFNYVLMPTVNLTTQTRAIVCLPKNRIVGGEMVPFQLITSRDALMAGTTYNGRGRYVGIVNANQVRLAIPT